MIEPGTLGGILLIFGAFALYNGKLLWSVSLYAVADIMWAILAYRQGDTFGMICVMIGLILGILVFIKSYTGVFVKDLKNIKRNKK